MVRLDTFLDQWKMMREDSAQAVESMPAGALDFRPAGDFLTFRELAVHMHDIGQGLVGMLVAGETQLTGPDWRQRRDRFVTPIPADAGAAEIAAALRHSLDADAAKLRGLDAGFLAGMIDKWDGTRITRMEMLLFTREHELTHRAQMFVSLRLNGVVPPTTQRRLAAQKNAT